MEKSVRNNIVLSVIPTVITIEDLLTRKDEWKTAIADYPVVDYLKPTAWYKLVAQGVPVRVFQELGL